MSKIPKELFITTKRAYDSEYDVSKNTWVQSNHHLFGFLHPHDSNPSTESKRKMDSARKKTQLHWAYYGGGEILCKDGIWFKQEISWAKQENGQHFRVITEVQIEEDLAPRVWSNEPLSGFKIVDTVNRYRGNKLYKVLDPRGIQFEVTIKSMFQILMESTVAQGEIMVPCVWAGNKNLVVAG